MDPTGYRLYSARIESPCCKPRTNPTMVWAHICTTTETANLKIPWWLGRIGEPSQQEPGDRSLFTSPVWRGKSQVPNLHLAGWFQPFVICQIRVFTWQLGTPYVNWRAPPRVWWYSFFYCLPLIKHGDGFKPPPVFIYMAKTNIWKTFAWVEPGCGDIRVCDVNVPFLEGLNIHPKGSRWWWSTFAFRDVSRGDIANLPIR